MRTSYWRLIALVSILLLAMAACGDGNGVVSDADSPGADGTATGADAADGDVEQVKLGVPLSLSGGVAFAGTKMRDAMELAFDEENERLAEHGIELVPLFEDDQSTQDTAITVTERLIKQEEVAAIVGYTASNICQAALPVAQELMTPAVNADCVVPGLTEIGDYIFRTVVPLDPAVEDFIAQLVPDLGIETGAILFTAENPAAENVAEVIAAALEDQGVEIVARESVPSSEDSDFAAQLTRIQEEDPDALGLMLLGGQVGPAMVQARDLGMEDTIFIGEQNVGSTEVLRTAGDAAANTYFATYWSPLADFERNNNFVSAYEERFGEEPDTFAANGYAGVKVMGQVIEQTGPPSEYGGLQEYRDAIRDALAGLGELETIYDHGTMEMVDRAAVIEPIVIQVIEGPEMTVYEPGQ